MGRSREIGGYLEFERFYGPMLHEWDIALNCGRACLEYLIELRDIRTLWLPDFLGPSVPDLCAKLGVETRIYSIGGGSRRSTTLRYAKASGCTLLIITGSYRVLTWLPRSRIVAAGWLWMKRRDIFANPGRASTRSTPAVSGLAWPMGRSCMHEMALG